MGRRKRRYGPAKTISAPNPEVPKNLKVGDESVMIVPGSYSSRTGNTTHRPHEFFKWEAGETHEVLMKGKKFYVGAEHFADRKLVITVRGTSLYEGSDGIDARVPHSGKSSSKTIRFAVIDELEVDKTVKLPEGRIYYEVDFDRKDVFKALGGWWDPIHKLWYFPDHINETALAKADELWKRK